MIFRILPGKHRSRPFRPWLCWRRTSFSWVVKFDGSCRYNLGNEDQLDINKLVGIGYLWHHHEDSARFGWRYDIAKDMIEISAYCYLSGRRIIKSVCYCEIGQLYNIDLYVSKWAYYFNVMEPDAGTIGETEIVHAHNKRLKYRLGPYFGGNQPAPHEMKIEIKKV